MQYTRLWIALALVIVGSFGVLGSVGVRAVTQAPPIPAQLVCRPQQPTDPLAIGEVFLQETVLYEYTDHV